MNDEGSTVGGTSRGRWNHDADCDVYIGRPSPFGNPFKVGKNGTREECLAKYEAYLLKRPNLVARARRELKGKKLGCFCKPGQRCHGEILIQYIDGFYEPLDGRQNILNRFRDPPPVAQKKEADEVSRMPAVRPRVGSPSASQPEAVSKPAVPKAPSAAKVGTPSTSTKPVAAPLKILVTGDREWTDRVVMERELRRYPSGTILVHGKCRGADNMAGEIGEKLGFVVRAHPAKWKTDGNKLAGPIRNARMLQREHPDDDGVRITTALAFHDDLTKSKGTRDMVNKAKLALIEVKQFKSERTVLSKALSPGAAAVIAAGLPYDEFGRVAFPDGAKRPLWVFDPNGKPAMFDEAAAIAGARTALTNCVSLVVQTAPAAVGPARTEPTAASRPKVAPLALPAKKLPLYDARAHGADCDKCPLNTKPVVPPTLPADLSQVDGILVGMNPGWEEARQGMPFVGPSGKQVDKLLTKFDLDRKRFHVTNAWLCQHKTEEEAFAASRCCQPRLLKEIEKYPKTVPVVPMGKEALQSAFGKKAAITKSRGFLWTKDGRDYLPTLHPAFVLRDKLQMPLISRDFRRLAKRVQLGQALFKLALDKPDYDYEKHTPRTLKQLERALKVFKNGPVACDIETSEEAPTRAELICIGISNGEHTIVVPWDKQFREPLRQFFKGRQTIFHNGFAFDTIVLVRYGIVVNRAEDTLIAHHTFASHFRQGLDHLASFYLDTIPWKILYGKAAGEEKGVAKNQDEREFFLYNAIDVHHTFVIWQRMQEDLKPHLRLYNRTDKKTAAICRKMTRYGVQVDLERRQQLIDRIKAKEERLIKQMREACGREFVPTKVDDIREILFEQFHAPVIERTEKKGLPSTGKKILEAFAATEGRPYSLFCRWLVDWRACTKMRTTYLDNLPIDKDGRVRPSWRSFGAYTGRFGCRRPNLMNLKRFNKRYKDEPEQHIRQIYVPGPGNCFVTYDMSQVEPRVAAYISNDPAFIKAIEEGDFHTNNARALWGDLPELVDLQRAKEGDGKPKRDVAKSCGLAVNYMAEAETLKDFLASQGYMMKLSVVQDMIAKLRKAYHVYFKFVQGNVELVQKQGWLKIGTISGRIRWLGFAPSPSSVADTPIQSTAADLMNNRLIAIDTALTKRGYYKQGVKIVAQIHDAVIFEVPIGIKEKIKDLIKKKMAKKFAFNGVMRSFPIDMKEGDRWSAL